MYWLGSSVLIYPDTSDLEHATVKLYSGGEPQQKKYADNSTTNTGSKKFMYSWMGFNVLISDLNDLNGSTRKGSGDPKQNVEKCPKKMQMTQQLTEVVKIMYWWMGFNVLISDLNDLNGSTGKGSGDLKQNF